MFLMFHRHRPKYKILGTVTIVNSEQSSSLISKDTVVLARLNKTF